MHIVSNDFIAQTQSTLDLLFVIILILLVLSVALFGYAVSAASKNEALEEEVERLERRINRLKQQNKTIYK